jgi:ribonuclease HII
MIDLYANDLALGIEPLAGADEAGRGPLAGPVVAAAVILNGPIPGLNDSKKLSEAVRERLYNEIIASCRAYRIMEIGPRQIDEINILNASLLGMRLAAEALPVVPRVVLIDGNRIPNGSHLPMKAVVKGDATYACIAAASILAKVYRDRLMRHLGERYPEYGFARHKGYPTQEHLAALRRFGPCPEHRRTYGPVAQTELVFSEPSKVLTESPRCGFDEPDVK